MSPQGAAYLSTIEKQLTVLTSSQAEPMPYASSDFTANEIQILELIKQGKQSKEIAAALNLSVATIAYHRKKIRKKIGISNKKGNIYTYLNTITQYPSTLSE